MSLPKITEIGSQPTTST